MDKFCMREKNGLKFGEKPLYCLHFCLVSMYNFRLFAQHVTTLSYNILSVSGWSFVSKRNFK